LCFSALKIFSNGSHGYRRKKISKQIDLNFTGVGKALIFSSDELSSYALPIYICNKYQFRPVVKKDTMQSLNLNEGDVLCNMPLIYLFQS